MNLKLNYKGASEILGYTMVILVISITVALIMTGLIPGVSNQQAKQKLELSKNYINTFDHKIKEVMALPNGSTTKINIDLDKLYLLIDSNQNKIEIYQITNSNFYKEKVEVKKDSIYTYKDKQKLVAGIEYTNINLISDELINNKKIELYITKLEKNKLKISTQATENVSWYDENWKYRKRLLLDSNYISADLNNFTVPVEIIDKDLGYYAKDDGKDIIFTMDDGTFKLKKEIDYFSEDVIYKKKITIDSNKVYDNLTDFTILISITDSNLSSYTREDGLDIYFTLSDGLTIIEREIEDYNFETGKLNAWVRIPELLKDENTVIYMFFGDKNQRFENSKFVWTEDYKVVQHLSQDGGTGFIGAYKDSTKNNLNGTYNDLDLSNNSNTNASGKIGKANYFDGNEYIDFGDVSQSGNWSKLSVSAWVKWSGETLSNYSGIWYKHNGNDVGRALIQASKKILYENGNGNFFTTNPVLNIDEWHLVTYVFNSEESKEYIYVDGNLAGEMDRVSDYLQQNNTSLYLGFGHLNNLYYTYFGYIDEFRISSQAKTENWIKTEYENQNDPGNFYSIGKIEEVGKKLIAYVKIPKTYANLNSSIYMYFGNEQGSEVTDTDSWDKYYNTVLHFTEKPIANGLGYFDSTKNKHNGVLFNFNFNLDSNTDVYGIIGRGIKLDGIDDYVSVSQSSMEKITYCMWVNKDFEEYKRVVYNSSSNYVINFTSVNYGVYLQNGFPSEGYHSTHGEYISKNENHYICWSYDKQLLKLYVDDHISREVEVTREDDISNGNLLLAKAYSGAEYFKGMIDELKISNTIRSDDWLKTEYLTQKYSIYLFKTGELEKNESN